MRAQDFLTESTVDWKLITSPSDKNKISDRLIDLVGHAYANTDKGSFVKSSGDVLKSDWFVLERNGTIIAAIFYRGPRGNEPWVGQKMQGLGHDGSTESKLAIQHKRLNLLSRRGWWIESSGASSRVLFKGGAPYVTDIQFLRRLFNDPHLRRVDNTTYVRRIPAGEIVETVFGYPVLK
ncbi:MAG TPA: hypothetical protein VFM18_17515 [Methanosarcina sp.]|nr:hypothetical protein [Methanosarcina sp.]